jgi:hypothetical protein
MVEHPTTNPEIEGSNSAYAQYQKKMAQKTVDEITWPMVVAQW